MNIVFSDHTLPTEIVKSIFLEGPSPRNPDQYDWRHDTLRMLKEKEYDGTVFIPIPEHLFYGAEGKDLNYDNQITYECKGRGMADVIVCWLAREIDRTREDLGMPGFTTNIELGEDMSSNKLAYGRPENAERVRYLDLRMSGKGIDVWDNLEEQIDSVLALLGPGSKRIGGEVSVPLFIWESSQFQLWYANLLEAGNTLHDAEVMFSHKIGKSLFSYVLKVNVWIKAEARFKSDELIFARTDISAVVAYHTNKINGETKILLVKEFRSPVNNPTGYVFELPSGSSNSPGESHTEVIQHELQEEAGLYIEDVTRFHYVGKRQLMATVSTHQCNVFSLNLTDSELDHLQRSENSKQVHGAIEDSEQTTVQITDMRDIFKQHLDYSMLGIIHEALAKKVA